MKKILVRGPALSRSGYGEQARFALRALSAHQDAYDIYLINTSWGATSWITEDDEERRWIDSLLQKTIAYAQAGGTYDISVQVTIPAEFERIAPYNVGYTAGIETTLMSAQWLERTRVVDKIIVPSTHSKNVIETSSWNGMDQRTNQHFVLTCTRPVDAVAFPVKDIKPEKIDLDLSTDFNFLAVAQWGPRKNLDATIEWFLEEFKNNSDVGLVVKTQIAKNCLIDKRHSEIRLKKLLNKQGEHKCKVYLLHGAMTEGEMTSLYQHDKIKAVVSTTHGEGFGLPLYEAAYNGLPVIATNWSAHKDFLYGPVKDKKTKKTKTKAMFLKVDYTLENIAPNAVWENVIVPESKWAVPKKSSYKTNLNKIYSNYGSYKSIAKKLQAHLKEEFSASRQYKRFVDALSVSDTTTDEIQIFT